jgi:YggT family protein
MGLIYSAINFILSIMWYAILARVIISWIPVPKDNQLIRLLYQITEPILGPIRGLIERSSLGKNMMMDFSPIIAFLLIGVLRSVLRSILFY